MTPGPIELELLVCPNPDCRNVGRNPSWQTTKGYCVGSIKDGTGHKKARMVPVKFREIAGEKATEGSKR